MAETLMLILLIAIALVYLAFRLLNRLHFALSKGRREFWTGIALKELLGYSWTSNEYKLKDTLCKHDFGSLAWHHTLKLIVRKGYATADFSGTPAIYRLTDTGYKEHGRLAQIYPEALVF